RALPDDLVWAALETVPTLSHSPFSACQCLYAGGNDGCARPAPSPPSSPAPSKGGLGSLISLSLASRQALVSTHHQPLLALRPAEWLAARPGPPPSRWQRLLRPSLPHRRSPHGEVGYHYAAVWTLAAAGLAPAGRVLLWAATLLQSGYQGRWWRMPGSSRA